MWGLALLLLPLASVAAVCLDAVSCGAAPQSLLLLTSSGFTNGDLALALRDLVLKLPDKAWADNDGQTRKSRARRRTPDFAAYSEPDLYSGLDVLMIDDPCLLKESFWNPKHAVFGRPAVLNYLKVGNLSWGLDIVRPFLGQDLLEGGWCTDMSYAEEGGMGKFGFESSRFKHLSLFASAPKNFFEALVKLRSAKWPLESKPHREATGRLLSRRIQADVQGLLDSADVILINGGSPDLADYILRVFAAPALAQMSEKVESGQAVFIGRSAGSMVASASMGTTSFEAQPTRVTELLGGARGLGFAPGCALRPHFSDAWVQPAALFEASSGKVVARVTNDQALKCQDGCCTVVGASQDPYALLHL